MMVPKSLLNVWHVSILVSFQLFAAFDEQQIGYVAHRLMQKWII